MNVCWLAGVYDPWIASTCHRIRNETVEGRPPGERKSRPMRPAGARAGLRFPPSSRNDVRLIEMHANTKRRSIHLLPSTGIPPHRNASARFDAEGCPSETFSNNDLHPLLFPHRCFPNRPSESHRLLREARSDSWPVQAEALNESKCWHLLQKVLQHLSTLYMLKSMVFTLHSPHIGILWF